MNTVILKQKLFFTENIQRVLMPKGAKIVEVREEDRFPALWFQCDPSQEEETRSFLIRGTGHGIEDGFTYVGTVHDHPFVWHILEKQQ